MYDKPVLHLFQSSMALRKIHRRLSRVLLNENEKKDREQTDVLTGEQISENLESPDQSEVCPQLIDSDSDDEVRKQRVLSTLRNILTAHSNTQDAAAERVEQWSKLISITLDTENSTEDGGLQEIDEFVESRFPKLPEEQEESQLQEFLKRTQSMMFNEVFQLTPVLEEVGLLDPLIDSCNRHLFTKLDLLLNRDLSVKETFGILMWAKYVFFSPDLQHVFRVSDPLLLMGCIERMTEKLLTKLQKEISTTLQNILHYDQKHGHHVDSMDEESFIRVHIDVTQCLNAAIQSSKEFSQTLTCTVQNLCLQELYPFVQRYVDTEKKCIEKQKPLNRNSLHLLRIISTCRQLRFFAPQLSNAKVNNSDLLNISCMLEEMEDHVLSIVQKMINHLAEDSLSHYFKKGDEHIYTLTEEMQNHCASLPQTDAGREIQKIFANVACDCVPRVYLDCLMKSKFKQLEKRWGNVGERMSNDAFNFQDTFIKLNGSDDQKKLLQRMSEVLSCRDVDALKVTFGQLYTDLPKDSEQYVPGLLRWRGDLSERAVRDVLHVIRGLDQYPNPRNVTCLPLRAILHKMT